MRKDDNLSTDVDRIPQFSWILFLKCFDDFEKRREALDPRWKPIIPNGYRWKDWASETDEKGNMKKTLTGGDLIKFVNDSLFPTLGKLVGSKDQKQKRYHRVHLQGTKQQVCQRLCPAQGSQHSRQDKLLVV